MEENDIGGIELPDEFMENILGGVSFEDSRSALQGIIGLLADRGVKPGDSLASIGIALPDVDPEVILSLAKKLSVTRL